jgi:hypothetical protein
MPLVLMMLERNLGKKKNPNLQRGLQESWRSMTNPEHHWHCRGCGRKFTPRYREELILIGDGAYSPQTHYHLSGPKLDGEQKTDLELEFTDDDGVKFFAHVCGPIIFQFANPLREPIIDVGKIEIHYNNEERIAPAVNVGIRGSGRSIQRMKIKIPKTKTRRLDLDD